jgi:hypothetical protein
MTDFDPLLGRRPLPPPALPVTSTTTPATRPATSRTSRPAERSRRRHPALGARIAAAGIGVSTMLGLVASMGIASALADQGATEVVPSTAPLANTPAPGVVIAAPAPAITAPAAPAAPATPAAPAAPAAGSSQAAVVPAPVTLTARPEVRVVTPQAPAAPAPAATTSGSR